MPCARPSARQCGEPSAQGSAAPGRQRPDTAQTGLAEPAGSTSRLVVATLPIGRRSLAWTTTVEPAGHRSGGRPRRRRLGRSTPSRLAAS